MSGSGFLFHFTLLRLGCLMDELNDLALAETSFKKKKGFVGEIKEYEFHLIPSLITTQRCLWISYPERICGRYHYWMTCCNQRHDGCNLPERKCPVCGLSIDIRHRSNPPFLLYAISRRESICRTCGGSGYIIGTVCRHCKGDGSKNLGYRLF